LLQAVGRILKIKVSFKWEMLSFEPHHGLNTVRNFNLFESALILVMVVGTFIDLAVTLSYASLICADIAEVMVRAGSAEKYN